MADKIPYHRVTARFDIPLHRTADISQAVPGCCLFDAFIQALAGSVQKPLCFCGNLSTGEGVGVVAVETFKHGSDVDAYNVASLDNLAFGRYAVDHHVVHRYTGAGRESAVPQKTGDGSL